MVNNQPCQFYKVMATIILIIKWLPYLKIRGKKGLASPEHLSNLDLRTRDSISLQSMLMDLRSIDLEIGL